MSTHQVFTIGTPCHEDWNKMSKVEKGRFCDVCAKCVVDLTGKSQKEIKSLFVQNKGNLCGSMPASQYNATQAVVTKSRATTVHRSLRARGLSAIQIFAASFVAAFGLLWSASAYGQSHHGGMKKGKIAYVKVEGRIDGGVVLDGKPVEGVTVVAAGNGERMETKTDARGLFAFAGLEPGTWSLSAFGDGYEAYETVKVRRGGREKVLLEMEEYLMMGDIAPIELTEVEEERIIGDTIAFEQLDVLGNVAVVETEAMETVRGEVKVVKEVEPVTCEVMVSGGIGAEIMEPERVEMTAGAIMPANILSEEPHSLEVGQMIAVTVTEPVTELEEPAGENVEKAPDKVVAEGFEAVVKPIPTSDELTVTIKRSVNADPIGLLIFSTEGKLVKTGSISGQVGSTAKFDISHLPAGVYYLKGLQDDYLFQQKILKL